MKLINECNGKVVGTVPEGTKIKEGDEVAADDGTRPIVIYVNEDGSRAVVSCELGDGHE